MNSRFFLISLLMSICPVLWAKNQPPIVQNDTQEVFYLKKTKTEINAFEERLKLLEKGDSYKKIVKILGTPTYDKKLYGKTSDAPLIARMLYYYMIIKEKRLSNKLEDRYFLLELDKKDRLLRITENNTKNFVTE